WHWLLDIGECRTSQLNSGLISVVDKFCDNKYCYGDIEGRPVYFDDDHLSEFGASKLIPEIEKQLQSHF
ncbi:SGNH hydrolase domain-containing protein, partial [Vibrio vulnificus]